MPTTGSGAGSPAGADGRGAAQPPTGARGGRAWWLWLALTLGTCTAVAAAADPSRDGAPGARTTAPAAPLAAAVTVLDDTGARVTVARPAQRIVSLAPHLTEQLFAIGAGAQVVAVSDFSDYPPAAAQLPRVARASRVDLEQLLKHRPDLIVVWGTGYSPAIVEALRRTGVPLFVSAPATLDDIATSMERLARLSGLGSDVAAVREYRAGLAALRMQYGARPPVTVFYQVWGAPLMTLSGRHVVSEAIRLCGGRNVFEALAPLAPQVSPEAVLQADPQVIATAEPAGRPSGALEAWQRFGGLRAVRGGHLVTLDADRINRAGPRMVEAVGTLCRALDGAR